MWSSITPDADKNFRRGQAVTPVGRFGQVDRIAKFSHIKGRICFLALHKVCLDLQKIKEENKRWDIRKYEIMLEY